MEEKEKMMKKLLIFMLVLGMASVAGATLTFNLASDSPTATFDGVIEFEQTIYLFIASDAPIAIDLGAAAPSMAMYQGTVADFQGFGVPIPTEYSYGEGWIMGAAAGEDYLTGTYLIGVGAVGDSVLGGWFDEVGGYGELGGGTLIPEPMTVLLLGLGGLFLRRRR